MRLLQSTVLCSLHLPLGSFVFARTILSLLESTAANGDDVRIVSVSPLVFISPVHWAHQYKLDPHADATIVKEILVP